MPQLFHGRTTGTAKPLLRLLTLALPFAFSHYQVVVLQEPSAAQVLLRQPGDAEASVLQAMENSDVTDAALQAAARTCLQLILLLRRQVLPAAAVTSRTTAAPRPVTSSAAATSAVKGRPAKRPAGSSTSSKAVKPQVLQKPVPERNVTQTSSSLQRPASQQAPTLSRSQQAPTLSRAQQQTTPEPASIAAPTTILDIEDWSDSEDESVGVVHAADKHSSTEAGAVVKATKAQRLTARAEPGATQRSLQRDLHQDKSCDTSSPSSGAVIAAPVVNGPAPRDAVASVSQGLCRDTAQPLSAWFPTSRTFAEWTRTQPPDKIPAASPELFRHVPRALDGMAPVVPLQGLRDPR